MTLKFSLPLKVKEEKKNLNICCRWIKRRLGDTSLPNKECGLFLHLIYFLKLIMR